MSWLRPLRGRGAWIGGVAILAAALASFSLQYATASRLAAISPTEERARLGARLDAISANVARASSDRIRRALDVPPAALVAGASDDVEGAYGGAPADGVERYFIVRVLPVRTIKITLYDPARRAEVSPWESVPGGELDMHAGIARNASIQWFPKIAERTLRDRDAIGIYEHIPPRYVLTRPIVGANGELAGVAGMMVDRGWLGEQVAADFHSALERETTAGERDLVAFDLVDDGARHRAGEERAGDADASAPLDFPFRGWRVEARARGLGFEALARRQLALGVAQQALVALLLAGGAFAVWRSWTREAELMRAKADFLSNVTHELQSPITSIQLYAELLRSGRLRDRDEIEECGEHVEREASRLGRLVANVLDFAKMDAGEKVYRFREADLEAVVRAVLDGFEVRLARAGLRVEIAAHPPLPDVVADADAIGQAVANLVDNAIKYAGDSERIAVGFGTDGATVSLSISDEGIGIPASERDRIFDRFYRVSTGLEHDAKGSGIGLSLVRHIVEAHRGRIEVASEPGRGSTFTITLPAIAREAAAPEAAREVEPARKGAR